MDDNNGEATRELQEIIRGEVHTDEWTRAIYSDDASILHVRPLAVVAPQDTDDLVALVKFAAEAKISLHPRGAGTGLAGESLGPGIVVDLSRYFTRILEVGDNWVRVEPGVRFANLQKELARFGRMLAVDPISGDRCTLGGMVATNAAGPHSLRYGTVRDHLLSVKGVLSSGRVSELGRLSVDLAETESNSELVGIIRPLSRVLAAYARAIQEEQPQALLKHGGYELRGVLENRTLHLPRLLAGSEGTLALSTEIELATVPIPPYRGMLLATFPSLQSAADAVVESLEYQPTACEMLDRRLIRVVRESEPWYRDWIPEDAESLLIIEHEGSSADNVVERIVLNQNRLNRVKRLASQTREVYGEPRMSQCWRIRDRAMPWLASSQDNVQPTAFVENAAVPAARLPEFLAKVQAIMRKHDVTATYAAHAGVGIVHARPLLDIHREDHRRKMPGIVDDMAEAVLRCGGTFNGEHGAGLLRSGLLPRQYPRLYPAFERIKSIFDPQEILNPGRITNGGDAFPSDLLRSRVAKLPEETLPEAKLRWPTLSVVACAERCNGCGACFTTKVSTRMCPSFRADAKEARAPRALANLMRQVLHGEIASGQLASDELREFADSCVYCRMCRVECPAGVDISKLMLEAKAANVAENGLQRHDWLFANWEGVSRWAAAQAHFANSVLGNPVGRYWLEKLFGLSRRRRLFRFQHRTFLQRAAQSGWTRKPWSKRSEKRVALIVDAYTNYNDPELGECVARLLIHHGHTLYVPPNQKASGLCSIQYGDIESARSSVLWNFEIAAELVREGFTIVTTEPSAAIMLRDEAANLIQDSALENVAASTYESSEYLALLGMRGDLRTDLASVPLTVAYHEPCHLRALQPRAAASSILRRIPGLRLVDMDLGCSGMAVTHGMRTDSFDASLRSGGAMLDRLKSGDIHIGATQCGACRMQMEQASVKATHHPVKLLALACNLLPQAERLFRSPNQGILSS